MSALELSFWHPGTGALIGILDDTQLKAVELRPALFQLGAISLTVSRHVAEATLALLKKGNLVTYRLPEIDDDDDPMPFGFVLRDDAARLISRNEQGGEDLTLTGPGMMAVLSNATLDEETWAPAPPASEERGSSIVPGQWFWRFQPYGAIYTRAIEEGINEPGEPLKLIDITFDRDEDSEGDPWEEIQLDYMVDTGTNVLELGDRLSMTGGFYPMIVPRVSDDLLELRLDVWQTIGEDLTATVRFEKAVNILTELERKQQATRITHLLIKDADGVFLPVFVTANAYDQAAWSVLELQETNDPDTIEKIATTALDSSESAAEEFTFEHSPDLIPLFDYQLGDLVRVHTGSGEHDLNETDQQVVGCRIILDDAAKSATEDEARRSLRTVIELGYRDTSGLSGTNPDGTGCSCPKPCRPGVPSIEA